MSQPAELRTHVPLDAGTWKTAAPSRLSGALARHHRVGGRDLDAGRGGLLADDVPRAHAPSGVSGPGRIQPALLRLGASRGRAGGRRGPPSPAPVFPELDAALRR